MDLDGGVIHKWGAFEGVGPEMGTSVASAIWPQKKSRFQGPPLQTPREMDFPQQVHW